MTRFIATLTAVLMVVGRGDGAPARPTGDPVVLLQPADTSLYVPVRPLLSWRSVPGASRYLLQISGDSMFAATVPVDSAIVDTIARPAAPLCNDSAYFWRVGVMDSLSAITFSPARIFRTGSLPQFSADSVDFPATRLGDSSVAFVVMKNRMPAPLLVDSVVSPSGSYVFLDGASFLLRPSDSLVCPVLYRPAHFGRCLEPLTVHTEQGMLRLVADGDSPPPVLGVSQGRADFGTISVTDTVTRTVMLRNRGTVNRLTFSLRKRRYSPFQLLRQTRGIIAPGESLTVRVRVHIHSYLPNGYGLHADTLVVESDGGSAAIPLVADSPPPRLRSTPLALVYPEVGISDTVARSIRVWNSSVNQLRIDSIRLGSGRFGCTPARSTVRRGDSTMFTFRFFPDRPGTVADTALLYNNSWVSPFRIPLTGYAPPPLLDVDRARQDYGQVIVGARASAHFTVVNRSVSPLRIDGVTTRTRAFTVSGWKGPVRLRYGDTVGVDITFAPDSLRQYQDTLLLMNNSLRSPHRIPLEGMGARDINAPNGAEPAFELFQNFPNPFSGETTFRYVLPGTCSVELEVFTTLGEHVETIFSGVQGEGFHNIAWAPRLATGVYYYRLRATPEGRPDRAVSATRKLVITR